MKVLYIVPIGDDLGGILTSTENLLAGFREAGHEVTFARLKPTSAYPRPTPVPQQDGAYYIGEGSGLPLHPKAGWKGRHYSIGNDQSIAELVALGNTHDIIVWAAMFGLRNEHTEGNTRWLRLFSDIKKPHVCMIRDDHLPDRYPWVAELEQWVVGWACVQRSSFDSCAGLRKPRAIIYSGHDVRMGSVLPMELRTNELFMMHTFKSWKRADRLVAAVPHLNVGKVVLAGSGIEYHYMTSETKCKPRYYCTKENDPHATPLMLGRTIWDNAAHYGMLYLGHRTATQRDELLKQCLYFVDLSMRPHSTGQINRTVVEAIKQGCVPICVPEFISGGKEDGELFKAHTHYLPVSADCYPNELATVLDAYVQHVTPGKYAEMQEAGQALIQKFDRKVAARQLVELALGARTGDDYAEGEADTDLLIAGAEMFNQLFRGK